VTTVLGISCWYHDAAACVIRDGVIVAAAEEERFTRRKHDSSFPLHAVEFCLRTAGVSINDVEMVGFYERPLLKFERILAGSIATFPRSYGLFLRAMRTWTSEKLFIRSVIKRSIGYDRDIAYVDHHVSHAAASFFPSPFREAAILTFDGVGEWSTATFGVGRDREVRLEREIRYPHSLGLLYSAFTAHLGFEVNEGEYKVMGMAPYGVPSYVDQLREIIDIRSDGSFKLNMKYFAYHYAMRATSPAFERLFGPARRPDGPLEQRHLDIAASIQRITEEAMLAAARHVHSVTGLRSLVLGGGVALNCVANGRILRETPFADMYIQPAAGDAGGAIGIAAYVYHSLLGGARTAPMRHAYLGPSFTDDEIAATLKRHDIQFRVLDTEALLDETSQRIADDQVVGWFQGSMEFGPRALGARSILANAANPQMKDLLNEKIKHREQFRPFAPAVLAESCQTYFELGIESPFMLLVAPVVDHMRGRIPAVTHVDGSARIQTVTRNDNGIYYDLIARFDQMTGLPVIINTSFNVRGEPIVCTPEQAFNCFSHTDMDYLVLGHNVVERDAKRKLFEYAGRGSIGAKEVVL
jgi:carbamoyltransferase